MTTGCFRPTFWPVKPLLVSIYRRDRVDHILQKYIFDKKFDAFLTYLCCLRSTATHPRTFKTDKSPNSLCVVKLISLIQKKYKDLNANGTRSGHFLLYHSVSKSGLIIDIARDWWLQICCIFCS